MRQDVDEGQEVDLPVLRGTPGWNGVDVFLGVYSTRAVVGIGGVAAPGGEGGVGRGECGAGAAGVVVLVTRDVVVFLFECVDLPR